MARPPFWSGKNRKTELRRKAEANPNKSDEELIDSLLKLARLRRLDYYRTRSRGRETQMEPGDWEQM